MAGWDLKFKILTTQYRQSSTAYVSSSSWSWRIVLVSLDPRETIVAILIRESSCHVAWTQARPRPILVQTAWQAEPQQRVPT